MPPRLVSALLVRNEADRDLRDVLTRCQEFSDAILVLDDGSTDDTVKIATEMGCLVKQRPRPGAWGNEAPARKELWERGAKLAHDGWLLVCDADMLLRGNPRDLVTSWEVNAWAFVLLDLWSPTAFRVDGPWAAGPTMPRPWLFRPSACPSPQWNTRGLHVGHCPLNFPGPFGVAPPDEYFWEHRAYSSPDRRVAKHAQYFSQQDQLSPGELAHAASILD